MARARSFGSIRKLPSGKFQARYWHLGKQIAAEHTFAAKTDARCSTPTSLRVGRRPEPRSGFRTFGSTTYDTSLGPRPRRRARHSVK